jgi:hypothetical protein
MFSPEIETAAEAIKIGAKILKRQSLFLWLTLSAR